jgi:hypothetical protein
MDGNRFKVRKAYRLLALSGLCIIITTLFPSSSALEVSTEDGRTTYEQGEIIIFHITGMNNSTVIVDLDHTYTNIIRNNTYLRKPYHYDNIALDENGTATVILELDPETDFGNTTATYGYWDLLLFEQNETGGQFEYLSFRYWVDVDTDIILQEQENTISLLLGMINDLLDGIWVAVGYLLFAIFVVIFIAVVWMIRKVFGEDPFTKGFRFLAKPVTAFAAGQPGDVDAVSHNRGETIEEVEWRSKDDAEGKARKLKRKAEKEYAVVDRIETTAQARSESHRTLAQQYEAEAERLEEFADSKDIATLKEIESMPKLIEKDDEAKKKKKEDG